MTKQNSKYNNSKRSSGDAVKAAAVEMNTVPPQAPEIEEAVIGAMMLEADCMYQALESLRPNSFYDPKMRLIFEAIVHLYNERSAVDMMTVTEQLRADEALEAIGGTSRLSELTQNVGTAANISFYIKILQQKTIQRDLINAAYGILRDAFDPSFEVDKLIQESQSQVYQAVQGNIKRAYLHVGSAVNDAIERIQKMQGRKGLTGVPSGFASLDEITMGWQPGNLIIIGARPSVGKTAFALNMARNAAVDHGHPAAFFSLEMTGMELADRLLAAESGIPSFKLKGQKDMVDADWMRLESSIDRLVKAPLFIDETPGISITEFTSKAKRLKQEQGIEIIFVDYLQLMHATVGANSYREQEVSEISRTLKETAKELQIPIIALAQLNRNPMNRLGSNGRPMLNDLRDSGSIEQDADLVMFVHRPGVYGLSESPDTRRETEIIIAKNRAGRIGNINMVFDEDHVRFLEAKDNMLEVAKALSEAKALERQAAAQKEKAPQQSWSPFDMMSPQSTIEEFEKAENAYGQ